MVSTPKLYAQKGFTLVELAIVLVIIGLIVGGVLVGRDLISAAEIRATVSQIEKYNAAVNTFRTRFNGLPGDLRNVSDFAGVLTDTVAGTGLGQGDGNRLLEDDGGGITDMTGEITGFWQHLSEAQLVDGAFNGNQAAAARAVGASFPRCKIDRSGIAVYGVNAINYFQIGATDSAAASAPAVYQSGLTPEEANNIDTKVDDGRPFNGQIIARGGVVPNAAYIVAAATAATTCALGDDAAPDLNDRYDTANTAVTCQLRFRMN